MNDDFEIKFRFACKQDPKAIDKLVDQFVTAVERTNSQTGGGCGPREGEFFVETGETFRIKDLQALLAIWLPHSKLLSVKAVSKQTPKSEASRATESGKAKSK
jgi:uncharacterized protein YggL (DUF469 family)